MISTSRTRHSTLRKVPRGRDDEERLSADMLGAPLPRRLAVAARFSEKVSAPALSPRTSSKSIRLRKVHVAERRMNGSLCACSEPRAYFDLLRPN